MYKKGSELSLNTIIIFILAILVLVFLVLLLSGVGGDAIIRLKEIIGDLVSTNID